jgi:uncharacterized protein (DUF1330 family)
MTVALHPTRESLSAYLRDMPAGEPVTFLNLLRFRKIANYPAGSSYAAVSGSDAFATYARLMMPLLDAAGAEITWLGKMGTALIAPSGEHWDEVVLVRYPDKDAFVSMTTTGKYVELSVHRTAALADSRLIALIDGRPQQAANQPTLKTAEHD